MQAVQYDDTGAMCVQTQYMKILLKLLKDIPHREVEVARPSNDTIIVSRRLYRELVKCNKNMWIGSVKRPHDEDSAEAPPMAPLLRRKVDQCTQTPGDFAGKNEVSTQTETNPIFPVFTPLPIEEPEDYLRSNDTYKPQEFPMAPPTLIPVSERRPPGSAHQRCPSPTKSVQSGTSRVQDLERLREALLGSVSVCN